METPQPQRPRVIVPDEYLIGVEEPLLLWAEDAAHLADYGIVDGDALIFDQAAEPQAGEAVALGLYALRSFGAGADAGLQHLVTAPVAAAFRCHLPSLTDLHRTSTAPRPSPYPRCVKIGDRRDLCGGNAMSGGSGSCAWRRSGHATRRGCRSGGPPCWSGNSTRRARRSGRHSIPRGAPRYVPPARSCMIHVTMRSGCTTADASTIGPRSSGWSKRGALMQIDAEGTTLSPREALRAIGWQFDAQRWETLLLDARGDDLLIEFLPVARPRHLDRAHLVPADVLALRDAERRQRDRVVALPPPATHPAGLGYEEALRVLGQELDRRGLRLTRVIEHADGLIVQSVPSDTPAAPLTTALLRWETIQAQHERAIRQRQGTPGSAG